VRAGGHLSAKSIALRLEQYGILVRVFDSSTGDGLDTMFRVTTGTDEEYEFFVDALDAVISAETERSKLVAG
jgi:histidinol-phosphate/aromatic aminotransferase/cobyric acid decarboxylase-like protein